MAESITQQWQLGPYHVTVTAHAAQAGLLPAVLSTLRQHHQHTGALREGVRIRFGWSELILVQQAEGVLLLGEPDFDGDPAQGIVPGICQTLEVYSEQLALAEQMGVKPEWTAYDETVLVEAGCLMADTLFLQRFVPEVWMADSGWSVSLLGLDPQRKTQHELLPAWQLRRAHPSLTPVLILPEGYGAVFEHGDIVQVWVVEDR